MTELILAPHVVAKISPTPQSFSTEADSPTALLHRLCTYPAVVGALKGFMTKENNAQDMTTFDCCLNRVKTYIYTRRYYTKSYLIF
jgi:hypothetical protein